VRLLGGTCVLRDTVPPTAKGCTATDTRERSTLLTLRRGFFRAPSVGDLRSICAGYERKELGLGKRCRRLPAHYSRGNKDKRGVRADSGRAGVALNLNRR
jgi:hypothetical protein